jgi:hypothetical protein
MGFLGDFLVCFNQWSTVLQAVDFAATTMLENVSTTTTTTKQTPNQKHNQKKMLLHTKTFNNNQKVNLKIIDISAEINKKEEGRNG